MEEFQEKGVLLSTLRSFGVSVPENISSLKDLTPTILISICCQSLNILGNNKGKNMLFPDSVEDSLSMPDKFKICTDISVAFRNLGYIGDMNNYKFLYPSEEDLYNLVRFLVERLSVDSAKTKIDLREKIKEDNFEKVSENFTQEPDVEEVDQNLQKVEDILKDLRVDGLLESSNSRTLKAPLTVIDPLREHDVPQNELFSESIAEVVESRCSASENEENADQKDDDVATSLKEINYEAKNLLSREKVLEESSANALQVQHLEEEVGLWKAAADMAFNGNQPMEFFLDQLNKQIDAKEHNIEESESQWEAFRRPLEEKKRRLEECLYANNSEALEKLQKIRDIELETQLTLSEVRKREEEHTNLSAEFENQPKIASRRSYIERIKEITKNSGKLDTDIERIITETRELQLESNSIQERLHRSYAVVDEIVFREAKNDPVGRQAYRLLTSIHGSFEQISEKILATDRIRREMADCEKKLTAMVSRSLNVDKLQADLDAIVKENEYLEQQVQEDN